MNLAARLIKSIGADKIRAPQPQPTTNTVSQMSATNRQTLCTHARVGLLVLCLLPQAGTATAENPFVAGFERFARHGEINSETAGRLLVTELGCAACHAAGPVLQPKRGPNLDGVGNRVSRRWLSRFLTDPQQVAPGTTMPAMLSGFDESERQSVVSALVAFLSDQTKPFPEIKATGAVPVPLEFWNHGQPERGRQLYHQIGCVACHEADESYETVATQPTPLDRLIEQLDPEQLKEIGLSSSARRVESVPHGDLVAKYSPQSLTHFLLDPHGIRPGGRMPDFKLNVDEASDLAAWLLRDQQKDPVNFPDNVNSGSRAAIPSELIEQGAQLFRSLGCANCHSLGGSKPTVAAKPLEQLDLQAVNGCVAQPGPAHPYYSLDDAQRAAMEMGLSGSTSKTLSEHAGPADHARFLMLQLNCLACHERDSLGGVGRYRKAFFETYGHIDIGDEGRLPPPLTNVGRKLREAWMTKVLQGSGAVRPHMRIRMPVFPTARMKQLPELLARADAQSNQTQANEREVFGEQTDLAEAGRLLLDTGCVQCHSLQTEALPGVVGVDLAGVTGRVHPRWFYDFLLNPAELKRHTRMPTFFPDGKSQNLSVLDGNTDRQIAALWVYLKNVSQHGLPPKIEKARQQNYELIPTDRPVILRTFMEEAGTHAIAVGFPDRIHFAWDAEGLYPAFAWKGRFLDARGTWFERFTPPAVPLDGGGVLLPPHVSFAAPTDSAEDPWPTASDSKSYRYLGHRLDKSGVPTFRYLVGGVLIEDRIAPTETGLVRALSIHDQRDSPERSMTFLAHSGAKLMLDGTRCRDTRGLSVIVPGEYVENSRLIKRDDRSEWHVPVSLQGVTKFEVRYEW